MIRRHWRTRQSVSRSAPGTEASCFWSSFCGDHRRDAFPNVAAILRAALQAEPLREIGFAPIEDRLYCVVFTDRGDLRRIISLRRATKQEVKY